MPIVRSTRLLASISTFSSSGHPCCGPSPRSNRLPPGTRKLKKNQDGALRVTWVRTSISNIGLVDIRNRLVNGNLSRWRLLRHQENDRHVSRAGRLGATKLSDRHDRIFREREDLTGPELDRFDLLRMVGTSLSTERIVEGTHANFLRLLRPPRRLIKEAKNVLIVTFQQHLASRRKAIVSPRRAGGMVVVKFAKSCRGSSEGSSW
jgi:hypothetical protein